MNSPSDSESVLDEFSKYGAVFQHIVKSGFCVCTDKRSFCVCLQSAGRDAENMKQILDQIRALHTDSTSTTSPQPPSEPIRQLSPLKALTEQLKRGSTGRRTRTIATRLSCLPAADPTGPLSPELADRVDLVLKELLSLNRKIDSNLQLLQPFVTFLRMAQQV